MVGVTYLYLQWVKKFKRGGGRLYLIFYLENVFFCGENIDILILEVFEYSK